MNRIAGIVTEHRLSIVASLITIAGVVLSLVCGAIELCGYNPAAFITWSVAVFVLGVSVCIACDCRNERRRLKALTDKQFEAVMYIYRHGRADSYGCDKEALSEVSACGILEVPVMGDDAYDCLLVEKYRKALDKYGKALERRRKK